MPSTTAAAAAAAADAAAAGGRGLCVCVCETCIMSVSVNDPPILPGSALPTRAHTHLPARQALGEAPHVQHGLGAAARDEGAPVGADGQDADGPRAVQGDGELFCFAFCMKCVRGCVCKWVCKGV